MSQPCKFCGAQIQMAKNPQGQWRPQNPDGTMHKCDRKAKPVPGTNEHQEFENQHSSFPPGLEVEVRRLAKEELRGFLQWLASQAEGQA